MTHFKIIASIIALLAIDLISKHLFFNLELLPGIFEATFNTGISFSIHINQILVEIITGIFICTLIYLVRTKVLSPQIAILLVSGALGNLFDRIALDGVRDFIRLGRGPVFNIADMYISLAAACLIYGEIIKISRNKK